MRRAAFSLLELLLVAALLMILTTMYWGGSAAKRERSRQAECEQNLQKIFIAMQIYANDQSGKFPVASAASTSAEVLDLLVPHYTVDTSVFICPGSHDSSLPSGESLKGRRISYAYYMGRRAADSTEALVTDRQINTLSKQPGQLVFSSTGKPPGNNHQKNGGNLLFCDGHIEATPPNASVSLVLTQGVVLLNPKP